MNTGKARKNQAGYVEGVDSLGRKSWRKVPLDDKGTKLLKMLQRDGVASSVLDAAMEAYVQNMSTLEGDFVTPDGQRFSEMRAYQKELLLENMETGAVTLSPAETQIALHGIFEGEDEWRRRKALESRFADESLLVEGVQSGNRDLVGAALMNPKATNEMFEFALEDIESGITEPHPVASAIRHNKGSLDAAILARAFETPELKNAVIVNANCPQELYEIRKGEVLAELAELEEKASRFDEGNRNRAHVYSSSDYRKAELALGDIMKSPKVDADFINEMAGHSNSTISNLAFKSPLISEENMLKAVEEEAKEDRIQSRMMAMGSNPAATPKVLEQILLADDGDNRYWGVYSGTTKEALKNPNITPEILETVWNKGVQHEGIIAHELAPSSIVQEAVRSEDANSRRTAVASNNMPSETLAYVMDNDENELVRRIARKKARERGVIANPPPISDLSVGRKAAFPPFEAYDHDNTYEVSVDGELHGYVSGGEGYWRIFDTLGNQVTMEGSRPLNSSYDDKNKDEQRKTAAYELVAKGY